MEKYIIGDKNIYVVQEHHHILEAWEEISLTNQCNVITFDCHTDTRKAFTRTAYFDIGGTAACSNIDEKKYKAQIDDYIQKYMSGTISCKYCIEKLKNDEFIDFAARTNIINLAFVVSYHNGGNSSVNDNVFYGERDSYKNQKIIEFQDYQDYIPDGLSYFEKRSLAFDNCVIKGGEEYIESFIPSFFENYILDIDLDYINTLEVFNKNISAFKNLIKDAKFITIAREPFFVRECMNTLLIEDEIQNAPEHITPLSDEIILTRLFEIIKESCSN